MLIDTEPASLGECMGVVWNMGAPDVVDAMMLHQSMLCGAENERWLSMAHGPTLAVARTDAELLHLAFSAPNALLFGLAYGKYVDALAMRQESKMQGFAGRVHFVDSGSDGVLHDLREWVLSKGYALELEAEQVDNDGDFFEQDCMLAQSRAEPLVLSEQICRAPTPFMVGQLLSWYLMASQIASPGISQEVFVCQSAENDSNFYDAPVIAMQRAVVQV